MVFAIVEDDQRNLWLCTNEGLSRFDWTREVFRSYDRADGSQYFFAQRMYQKSKRAPVARGQQRDGHLPSG